MIFEDLKAFVVVARYGSFARAAADLCTAQSALSKRVQRLEHAAGTALLERRARGVALTVAGHAFLVRAQRLVDELVDMERNLSSFVQTPSGEVRLALSQRTCELLAPPVIQRCRDELPLVNLQVLEGTPSNVHGWLLRGEADIALTYNRDLGSGFVIEPVFIEPLFLFTATVSAADHFGRAPPVTCSLADLARVPLVLPRKPNAVRVLMDRLCAGHGIRPNIVYETDSTATMRGMVERGMAAAIFSLSTSWSYLVESGQLIALPFASSLVNWKLYLARTDRGTSAVAIDRVAEVVSQELHVLINSGAWPNARPLTPDVVEGTH
jgi:LysR family transcriptional regulator, nitrogen assimilation regulatory protein